MSQRSEVVRQAGSGKVLDGVNPTAVIAAIKARARNRSAGRNMADGRRIGLVIEGGGMRGVCSAGSLVALEDLGLTDIFDEVYATSAGAMNASYFLSRQARHGITMYYREMLTRHAVSFLRPWKVLDIDWIIDRVVGGRKRLQSEAILSSRTRLFVNVLDAVTGEPWLVDTQRTRTPLLTVLKACTAVPVAYNRAIAVDGRSCIDAGVASPFPLREALASECTDLLVLLTRPRGFPGATAGTVTDLLFRLVSARGNAALLQAFRDQPKRDAELRALALGRVAVRHDVNIATLCAEDDERIGRLTRNPARLHAAALRSGHRMLAALGTAIDGWTLPPVRSRESD
jgi:predicted acylesterase/phospholipase RssA